MKLLNKKVLLGNRERLTARSIAALVLLPCPVLVREVTLCPFTLLPLDPPALHLCTILPSCPPALSPLCPLTLAPSCTCAFHLCALLPLCPLALSLLCPPTLLPMCSFIPLSFCPPAFVPFCPCRIPTKS